MGALRDLDRAVERRVPRAFAPTTPLQGVRFAIVLLLVSIGLALLVGGGAGASFTGGAIGVLLSTARQLRREQRT